jgi:hypothetical protein
MVQVDFSNCSVEVSPVPLRPCPSDMIPSNYRRWRVCVLSFYTLGGHHPLDAKIADRSRGVIDKTTVPSCKKVTHHRRRNKQLSHRR